MIHSRAGAMREHIAGPRAGRRLQQAGNANGVADGDADGFGGGRHGYELTGGEGLGRRKINGPLFRAKVSGIGRNWLSGRERLLLTLHRASLTISNALS